MEVVRRLSRVHLSVCCSCFRGLITEINLVLGSDLQFLSRHNPELVVPCSSITFCVGHLAVNDEHMIRLIASLCLDSCRERIPSAVIVEVNTLLLAPCTHVCGVWPAIGFFQVVVLGVGQFAPCSLCVSIYDQFPPFYRTSLLSLLVGDFYIRDPPVAHIVATLYEQLAGAGKVLCVRIVLASFQYHFLPVCCDGNSTRGSRTGERSMKLLCNRTLNLEGDGVRGIILQLFNTEGLELYVIEIGRSFFTVEMEASVFHFDACCGCIAAPATIPFRCDSRVVNFQIDHLFCLCSQETCQESNKSKYFLHNRKNLVNNKMNNKLKI